MFKSKYILRQDQLCVSSGTFKLYQGLPDKQQTTFNSEISFIPAKNEASIGKFQQTSENVLCCCSCQPIIDLRLEMYGQHLSLSSTSNQTLICPCVKGKLLIRTPNNVILGFVIRNECNLCYNKPILTIQNAEQKQIYSINASFWQCGFYFPRFFRCGSNIEYKIMNTKNEQVGEIINLSPEFIKSIFTLQDKFEINLPIQSSDRDKILLLNALIYLDIIKHQFL